MKIVFFSEIRWDYLKTRKQQILSRFPKEWQILFLQPYKAGKKFHFAPIWQNNICIATVPFFFKNFKLVWIKWLLSFGLVRFFILAIGWLWTKIIIRQTNFVHADLIMCSNIYTVPFIKRLAKGIPVIYDMNDDHLGFSHTPTWAKGYFAELCEIASRVVMPHESMRALLLPFGRTTNFVVTNGVDYELFANNRKIILYVGTISEWIDMELLLQVARKFPDETLRLIGPVATNVIELGRLPNVEFIGPLDRRLVVEQIKQAAVCLIPFKSCATTAHTTNINKIFEYFATGKPIVTIGRPLTYFEAHTPGMSYAAQNHDDFIALIEQALDEDKDSMQVFERKAFAESHDWNAKAKEMIEIINEVVT